MCQIEQLITGINWVAVLTLLVGGFAAYIARQQWKTAAYKVKLDLFDRRFHVFLRVKKMLSQTETADTADYLKFRTGISEVFFLFKPEMEAWIHEIYLHGINLSSARLVRKLHPLQRSDDWDPMKNAQIMYDEETWLGSQLEIAQQKFKPYLDFSKL